MLHPPDTPRREKISLVGPFGTGKSYTRVALWKAMQRFGYPGHLYVMDTDEAVECEAAELGNGYLDNIARQQCWEWGDFQVIDQWRTYATADDILYVDRIEAAWSAVEDDWTGRVFGRSSAQVFLEYHQEHRGEKGGSPLADAYGSKWSSIKKVYREWWMKVRRWPGHIIVCGDSTPLKREGNSADDAVTIQTFNRFGVRPAGEKNMWKEMHSILLMGNTAQGWVITTMRDRNRRELVAVPHTDFVMNYLVPVAGWRP